jgi:hypothetical protein
MRARVRPLARPLAALYSGRPALGPAHQVEEDAAHAVGVAVCHRRAQALAGVGWGHGDSVQVHWVTVQRVDPIAPSPQFPHPQQPPSRPLLGCIYCSELFLAHTALPPVTPHTLLEQRRGPAR